MTYVVTELKFKKLNDKAVIPKYAKPGDAGLDMTCTSMEYNKFTKQVTYGIGLAIEIPLGHVGLIFPRSGIYKYDLTLSNAVGVIDNQYRGEVRFVFNVKEHKTLQPELYKVGDRIGQLVVMPFPMMRPTEVQSLSETERGDSGFGSSGK